MNEMDRNLIDWMKTLQAGQRQLYWLILIFSAMNFGPLLEIAHKLDVSFWPW